MQAILGLERLMSVKLQRLNTSKVANVGVKAKVWPDEQCRRVVWLSGSGVWWVLENVEAEEREGGSNTTILRPRSRSGSRHAQARKELSERKPGGKGQVMRMVIQAHYPIQTHWYGATRRV